MNQPVRQPCDGCGIPIVTGPARFYGRDHRGSKTCDGLLVSEFERYRYRNEHFIRGHPFQPDPRRTAGSELREWVRKERERYRGL